MNKIKSYWLLIEVSNLVLDRKDPDYINIRNNLAYYLDNMIDKFNIKNKDLLIVIANKYLKGKRAYTLPNTKRNKKLIKERNNLYKNIPSLLINYLDNNKENKNIIEYKNGNQKAINSFVGMTIKFIKENNINIDKALIKDLILNYYGLNDG